MTTVGLVGAGAMGSALGAGWRDGDCRVVTALEGRSERTRGLVADAGIDVLDDLDAVLSIADVVVSVVPPGAAVAVARDLASASSRAGSRPLVVDLNAVAPSTVAEVGRVLAEVGCDLVDGSISGGPPAAGTTTRVYLAGPRAGDVPPNPRAEVVLLGDEIGRASALKMCTASMYKGTRALVMQALLTAEAHGVRDEFLADTARAWPADVPGWPHDVAVAAAKAWRFVDEMREIALTQSDAGLPAELFDGVAAAYVRAAGTELGHRTPEDVEADIAVADVLAGLRERG